MVNDVMAITVIDDKNYYNLCYRTIKKILR